MRASARIAATPLIALQLCASVAFAQTADSQVIELGPADSTAQAANPAADGLALQPPFTQPELDQMLAPIALYPDALLSQILMASTYPIEVVRAARWSKANPQLSGDQAVKAVEQNSWDPSVKSMVAFPQIISMMDEKLDWTQRLGDAFLSQQQQVMETVQELRRKAQAAGNLDSNENVRVEPQGQTIVIEQANPQVVYVPYYDPTFVYGSWWYSAYPPVYWRPWPGYYPHPGFGAGFYWGAGIGISTGFFFGACDWHHRHVTVVNVNNYYYRPSPRYAGHGPGNWYHDPGHRRGVPYRDPMSRQQSAHTATRPDARRDFSGNPPQRWQAPAAVQDIRPDMRSVPGSRADTRDRMPRPDGTARPAARNARSVPRADGAPNAPSRVLPADSGQVAPSRILRADGAPTAPTRPMVQSGPMQSRPHVFEGVGQGPVVRESTQRGNSSYQRASPPLTVAQPQRSWSGPRQGVAAARQPGSADGQRGQAHQR
jgi:hypothetical protein